MADACDRPSSVLVAGAAGYLGRLGLSRLGSEQGVVVQYRPVLSNVRREGDSGCTPRRSCEQTFRDHLAATGRVRAR